MNDASSTSLLALSSIFIVLQALLLYLHCTRGSPGKRIYNLNFYSGLKSPEIQRHGSCINFFSIRLS